MSTGRRIHKQVQDRTAPELHTSVTARHPDHAKSLFQLCLLLGDALAAGIAIWAACSPAGLERFGIIKGPACWSLGALGPLWLFALFLGEHYTLRPARSSLVRTLQLAGSTAIGTLGAIALTFILVPSHLSHRLLYCVASIVAWLLFTVVREIAIACGPDALVRERVLIVGTGPRSKGLIEALLNGHNPNEAQVVGAIRANTSEPEQELPCRLLGDLDDCLEVIAEYQVNHLVISPAPPLSRELIHCAAHSDAWGVRVQTMESAYEELTWRAPIFNVGEAWMASLDSVNSSKYATWLKRFADLILTILFMPLALPIIAICAILVKLLSGGPVFYRQERIGKDGVPFTFTKLRTMVVDAEARTGPVWAMADDPRITPIGRFLRRTRLDELPQLFSVLNGDMSLIGPRPERAHFVDKFKREIPLYEKRLMVRPGITGWAQVHHNYDRCTDDVIEKLRYDLYYVRHLSLSLDIQIILKTIGVVLGKKGAH